MKVLIAGASGYIGAHVAEFLADSGFEVVALMRKAPADSLEWQNKMANIIIGDIQNDFIIKTIKNTNVDKIIYTISLDHKKSEENIQQAINTNITPLWKLLDVVSNSRTQQLIYFSTQQVYGKLPFDVITEKYVTYPTNNYGLTHLMCEKICRKYDMGSNISCVSLRISNGYGAPRFKECNCWWLVINDLCKTAFNQKKILISSDGSPQRDFIHISDICQAVKLILDTRTLNLDHTYNLGSAKTFTILEAAKTVANCFKKVFDTEIPIFIKGKVITYDNKIDTFPKVKYNIDKIQALGYGPKMTLEEGVIDILNYIK